MDTPCIFCKIVSKTVPANVVFEDLKHIAFLDKYPRTRGHLQMVPKQHYRWLYELPDIGDFFTTAQRIIHGIIPVLRAHHVTISSFGNQITHAHLWIVPQYTSEVIVKEESRQRSVQDQREIAELLRNALSKGV